MSDGKNNRHNNKHYFLSFGIGFGLLGGALLASIIGTYFKLPYIWFFVPGLGALIGMAIGAIIDKNNNNKQI